MKNPKSKDYKGNPMGYFADKSRARKKAAFGTPGTEDEDPPMTKAEFKAEKKALKQKNALNKIAYHGDQQQHKAENKLNDDRTFFDKANQTVETLANAGGKLVSGVTSGIGLVNKVVPTVNAVKGVFSKDPAASPGNSDNYAGGANVAPGMTTTPATIPAVNTYDASGSNVSPVKKITPAAPVSTRRTTSRRYKKGGPTSKTDMSKVRKNAKKTSPLLSIMDEKKQYDKAKKFYIK